MINSSSTGALIIFGEALIDAFPENDRIGGAPFNVARTVAAFDCAPLMITRVGSDSRAELIDAEMRRFGLDQSACQVDQDHTTGLVRVHLEGGSHRFEIAADQAYDYIDSGLAQAAIDTYLAHQVTADQPVVLYFGTLAQRQSNSRQTLDHLINHNQLIKYLDLNLRDGQTNHEIISASLLHADILKINEDELQVLVQAFILPAGDLYVNLINRNSCAKIFDVLGQLMALFKLSAIIVTLGAHGYIYLNAAGQQVNGYEPIADPVDVVDTVGCGDAFSAIFLVGLRNAWPVAISLQRAHAFAGQICTIQGAVSIDAEFYASWQRQWATFLIPTTPTIL